MNERDSELWQQLLTLAQKKYDGHLTVMKFTTNWRIGFYQPADRDQIQEMAVGSSFAEAAEKVLTSPE